jgi:SSS family solute:Na+ symporter
MHKVGSLELFMVGLFLFVVIAQGVVFRGRPKTLRDYFISGKRLPFWMISVSLYASLLTPMSFVGVTSWVYQKDSRWLIGSSIVGLLTISIASRIWVPLWDRLRPLSIYEYLEQRFSPSLRIFAVAMFICQMIFWLGNELVTTAGMLELSYDLPPILCLLIIMAIGAIYTVVGGARSDIVTEQTQFLILVTALFAIAIELFDHFGKNLASVYHLASLHRSAVTAYPHTQIVSTELSLGVEGTIWAIIFARFTNVMAFGTEQLVVQRLTAVGVRREMYYAMIGFGVLDVVVAILAVFTSWELIAFYQNSPGVRPPAHPDQVLIAYSLDFASPFVRGLVMCGLSSALLSSFGTGLNSVSNVMVNDCYRRFWRPHESQGHYLLISRAVVLVACLVLLLFALWQYQHREVTVLQRVGQFTALVSGPIACFFMLGVFSRRTNAQGAIAGGFAALMFSLIFNGIPGAMPPYIPGINWMWIGGMSMFSGFAIGYLVSLLFTPKPLDALDGLTVLAHPKS